ncbi:UvrB/UvrC motif-containing protein [Desulfuribacillus alkaliarsenatis]|uniref:UVR domain-containing protein n=1 Tax=Desulfuribacillus alkaliarsenatis TaxID=766136 RepID=A0A1E5G4F9_9FIRM|nr:UvrB/UvrC motif-containing protein [Desulfuribacillus alkaliarsenatis]OEF97971.1 hypothetical protein BHF68_12950 [Desulfuribacillus alkaliarsenatis]
MDCQECKKRPAAVHLTKIINNKKSEMHLCEQCAKEKGDVSANFSFHDLLSGLLNYDNNKTNVFEQKQCQQCGMTFQQFYKVGKLGCADCYQYFGEQLDHILRKVQGKLGHTGKIPKRIAGDISVKRQISQLRQQLQNSIYEERFEEAAAFRDQIKALEKQLEQ